MARLRQMTEWDRTAAILSTIYNMNRDPQRSKAMSPADFNPYRMEETHAKVVKTP